jgi:hypothetical protein
MRKAPSRLASFQLLATLSKLEIDFILAYFKSGLFGNLAPPRRCGHRGVSPFNSSDYGLLQSSLVMGIEPVVVEAHVKSGFLAIVGTKTCPLNRKISQQNPSSTILLQPHLNYNNFNILVCCLRCDTLHGRPVCSLTPGNAVPVNVTLHFRFCDNSGVDWRKPIHWRFARMRMSLIPLHCNSRSISNLHFLVPLSVPAARESTKKPPHS